MTEWIAVGSEENVTKDALREDAERMQQIATIISNQEPLKIWVVLYWHTVAIGHLLEWVVTRKA